MPIKLIVRGVCCLRPGRKNLSENIYVCSLVGQYLEHARIFYFHNKKRSNIYIGSPDVMLRSFNTRIESLAQIIDEDIQKQMKYILYANLKDNQNSYIMQTDGTYLPKILAKGEKAYSIHEDFYQLKPDMLNDDIELFDELPKKSSASATSRSA